MKLTEKIAYMKGLFDGMEINSDTKEGKVILQMADVMEEMAVYIDDLQSQVDELTELCDLLDKDLGEVESDLYCDDDEEDDDEDEDEYSLGEVLPGEFDDMAYDNEEDFDQVQYTVTCPSCDVVMNLSERQLEEGSIICSNCGELLEFNYDNIEADFPSDDSEEEAEKNSDSDAE